MNQLDLRSNKSADPLRAVERVRVSLSLTQKQVNQTVTSPNPSQHGLRTFPEVPPWIPGGSPLDPRWIPGGIRKNPAAGKRPSKRP